MKVFLLSDFADEIVKDFNRTMMRCFSNPDQGNEHHMSHRFTAFDAQGALGDEEEFIQNMLDRTASLVLAPCKENTNFKGLKGTLDGARLERRVGNVSAWVTFQAHDGPDMETMEMETMEMETMDMETMEMEKMDMETMHRSYVQAWTYSYGVTVWDH